AEITNEFAKITNEFAEITNEFAEITNEFAEITFALASKNRRHRHDCNNLALTRERDAPFSYARSRRVRVTLLSYKVTLLRRRGCANRDARGLATAALTAETAAPTLRCLVRGASRREEAALTAVACSGNPTKSAAEPQIFGG
ncbi:MAG: hypothetical protein V7K40_19920, partial [Nostoc sp.]|uniref:hypothetical protein n=1 Tax=Nostoc sp. TaxID=1180 RepID=UPI002FF77766